MSTMSSNVKITDLPWEHIICRKIFPCLRISTLFGLRCVSRELKALVQLYFNTLFSLNISRCSGKMTAVAFEIMTCNNYCIKVLNLSNSRDFLSNDGLVPVLRRNPLLSVINFASCSGLSNVSLQSLASECPSLKTLILRDCHWVNDDGLLSVALRCDQLVTLDLTGCWNLGNNTLKIVIGKLENLEVLSLAKIYGVTNDTVNILAQTCKRLRHLNIHGCWRVTNDAIWLLGEYCSSLKLLQVKDCRDINEISLSKLRAKKVRIDVAPPVSAPNLAKLSRLSLNLQT
ncbi:F-box/LRR-repeat protein 15 isoform X1 [Patella vulgata]|uniref:F-box/LRR-repeat protein 15 isoform X1 n=1 Tax=Patella vulgata TaxID=6465 RepID=UPI0021803CBC|nr:F-box/LRR-repeat protein 15 isoform X1 [Patella vulgata]XP_055955134.1 F-box/LRR-repeat protein 15 isoform X1 [Patella vulgata]